MQQNVQELLKNKDEKIVQFIVVNTTSQNQFVDLFNIDTLNPVATTLNFLSAPNTILDTFGTGTYQRVATNVQNGHLYATDGSINVNVFDTNNNNLFILNLIFPTPVIILVYNLINNTFYFFDVGGGFIYVVDGLTNVITSTLIYTGGTFDAVFVSSKNSIYAGSSSGTIEIDCISNLIILTGLVSYASYSFNLTNNDLYGVQGFTDDFDVINIVSNTVTQSIFSSLSSVIITNSNINTPFNYVAKIGTGEVRVFNWSTSNSFVTLLSPSVGDLGRGVYDSISNNVYFGSNIGHLVSINGNNTFQAPFISASSLPNIALNQSQNSIFIASPSTNNINQVTTIGITATNFFITGSINYNSFINNLITQPIFIKLIRVFVQNQVQLFNELQFTKIDANGYQLFSPIFPITKIDTYARKGLNASIDMKSLVFDGRTFINQYQLNPFETISFEIYFKELDLMTVTPTLPMFFKPKVQLNEYIKNKLDI